MMGVMLDRDSLERNDLDLGVLRAALPAWRLHPATTPDQVVGRVREADVVVTNKVVLDAAVLDQAPRLKLIAVAATGTNNVDLNAARAHGIAVCNVPAYATPSVVQHTLALILALTRRLPEWHRAAVDGRWAAAEQFCLLDFSMRELSGRTLGIVGYGELGRAVAQAVRAALGMEVLVAQRPGGTAAPGRVPLEQLLSRVDVLSLHCPLTAETRNLIGPAELARMRPDALLINTARGGLVDETALVQALRAGRLGGAGIDVLTREPPRDGNPLLEPNIPNLIVTPHVAWASREARQRLVDQVADNIRAFVAGAARNRVV